MDLKVVLKKILILVNLNLIYEKVYGSLPSQTACAGKFFFFLCTFLPAPVSVLMIKRSPNIIPSQKC